MRKKINTTLMITRIILGYRTIDKGIINFNCIKKRKNSLKKNNTNNLMEKIFVITEDTEEENDRKSLTIQKGTIGKKKVEFSFSPQQSRTRTTNKLKSILKKTVRKI